MSEYVAQENMVTASIDAGELPPGVRHSGWTTLFSQAFENGPGTVHFDTISQAIGFVAPKLQESAPRLLYLNQDPENDHFAVFALNSAISEMYFPSNGIPDADLDTEARFLRQLRMKYGNGGSGDSRLQVVVYTTTGRGLLKEGCVLYWINENGLWRLAGFHGTD